MMTLVFASFLRNYIKTRLLGPILGASMCCEYLQPYVLCYGFPHSLLFPPASGVALNTW